VTRPTRITALAAAAALLAACGSQAGQVTPNGAADPPVTLTAVSYNVTGRSGGDQLAELTRLVAATSHGSVKLRLGPEPDSGAADTSADTIAMLRAGRADIAVVSARTFDTLGVTSFQALQAPYVVRSLAQADSVLADPLVDRMLAGVKPLGLVGLGLAFDFLAYPGGFHAPVVDLSDYRGQPFQVRPSRANDLLVQALGATSDYRNGQEMEEAVAASEIRGSWGFFDGVGTVSGETFTANAPAFLRANVILANAKVFSGLTATQQQALRDAATQTRDWMAERHQDPVAAAAAYCAAGFGDIVLASPAQQQAVEAATAPVTASMEQDPFNRAALARIRQLGSDLPEPAVPQPCSAAGAPVALPTLDPAGDQGVIDGVWRLEVDAEPLREAGWAENDIANNIGTWTWTFHDGDYEYVEAHGRVCQGSYAINGQQFLIVNYEPIGCDLVLPLVLARSGDQLRFGPDPGRPSGIPLTGDQKGLMSPDPAGSGAFFHNPLVRVGDAT
jgi:TRAP-type C4-dicarboxylate transport system substrate-binding protein